MSMAPAKAEAVTVRPSSLPPSLPYITDVNPTKTGFSVVVEIAGPTPDLVVSPKPTRIEKVDAHTWAVDLKKGKLYTFKAKNRCGSREIQYKIRKV